MKAVVPFLAASFLVLSAAPVLAATPTAPVRGGLYACPGALAPADGIIRRTRATRCCDLRSGCGRYIGTTRARIQRLPLRT